MVDASFWIITTFAFGATTLIALIAIIALWFFMKPEGRYFFRSSFKGGIDHIRHEPVSNNLILDTLTWNGETFMNKLGIYYPLRSILNPQTESEQIYNEAISTASRWKGSKRPVVMTTDLMSFAVGPSFYAALLKAHNSTKYDEDIRGFLRELKQLFDETGVKYFSFIDTFTISEIQNILKDVPAKKVKDSYRKGVNAEKLKNTKIKGTGLGAIPLWAIMLILIGIVAAIAYFLFKSGYLG